MRLSDFLFLLPFHYISFVYLLISFINLLCNFRCRALKTICMECRISNFSIHDITLYTFISSIIYSNENKNHFFLHLVFLFLIFFFFVINISCMRNYFVFFCFFLLFLFILNAMEKQKLSRSISECLVVFFFLKKCVCWCDFKIYIKSLISSLAFSLKCMSSITNNNN